MYFVVEYCMFENDLLLQIYTHLKSHCSILRQFNDL